MSRVKDGPEAKADLIARAMDGCVSKREMKRMADAVGVSVPDEEWEAVYGRDRGHGQAGMSKQARYYARKKCERLGIPVPDEYRVRRKGERTSASGAKRDPVHDVSGQRTMRRVIEGFCTSRMASFIENWDKVEDPARKCDLYLKAAQFVLPRLASVAVGPDASMTSFAEELRAMAGEASRVPESRRELPDGPVIEAEGTLVESGGGGA